MSSSAKAPDGPKARGRPRSEQVRNAVLTAARELVHERGLDGLSVDQIAARSGASKATVYRWWPNKRAVVIEALFAHNRTVTTFADTGDLRTDLAAELKRVVDFYAGADGRAMLELVGHSAADEALAQEVRARVIGPACDGARARLQRGQDAGQLRRDIDLDLVINLVWGPLYHRLLVTGDPVTRELMDTVLEVLEPAFLPGIPAK